MTSKKHREAVSVISRYESKYLISRETAQGIRDYIRPVCSPDKHAGPDGLYTVNNLYFETADLRFYYDTKFKRFNRFKPRVRYYGDRPEGFLWLELKHKFKNVTWKTRRSLPVEEWESLFEEAQSNGGGRFIDLRDSFEDAVLRFSASPIVHVRYVREPYVSDLENYCRITLDRSLTFRPAHGSFELAAPEGFEGYDDVITTSYEEDESPVLLEIKTETEIPFWVVTMIRRFGLQQRGFSKYCYALDRTMAMARPDARVSVFQ